MATDLVSEKGRVNTISQLQPKTIAGTGIGGFDSFFTFSWNTYPLGKCFLQSHAQITLWRIGSQTYPEW